MRRAIRHLSGASQSTVTLFFLLLSSPSTGQEAAQEGSQPSSPAAAVGSSPVVATTDERAPTQIVEPYVSALYDDSEVTGDASGVSMFSVILKLGLGLGVVILLVWGSVAVLRKSSLGKQFSANTGRIRVLERSYLGPKKSICLVRIGQRALALGVTEGSITTLAQLDEGDLPAGPDPGDSNGNSFVAQFRSILSNKEQSRHLRGEVGTS